MAPNIRLGWQIEDRDNAGKRLQSAIDALDILIHIPPPGPSLELDPELTTEQRDQLRATRAVLQTALDAVNAQYGRLLAQLLANPAGGASDNE